jgi:hypothetical protein
MIDYKIIKYCRFCKKKFIVRKGESKRIYCDECQEKIDTHRKEMEVKE